VIAFIIGAVWAFGLQLIGFSFVRNGKFSYSDFVVVVILGCCVCFIAGLK